MVLPRCFPGPAAADDDRLTLPIGLGVAKTTTVAGMPVKFNVQADYSTVRPDSFGAEWLFKINVTPVIASSFQ